MRGIRFATLFAILFLAVVRPGYCDSPERGPRRVFVLHSGLHTIFSDPEPNLVSLAIQKLLEKHGVAERDIIVLGNPYPVASWKNMFPRESMGIFLNSMLPGSKVSQEAYLRLHRALTEAKVRADDRLVWIGHSAGGQMGLTMAHLSHWLTRYPELARAASSYRFEMVVTLGAPLGSNPLPDDVKLRHYFSPQDRVVRWACLYGTFALGCLGHSVQLSEVPPHAVPDKSGGDHCIIRLFQGVEHPCWDEERVVSRILDEFSDKDKPCSRLQSLSIGMGPSLSRLLCRALEDECQISLE